MCVIECDKMLHWPSTATVSAWKRSDWERRKCVTPRIIITHFLSDNFVIIFRIKHKLQFTECCGTFCLAAGWPVALLHVGKISNRCFVGKKTEVNVKCYEKTFLRVQTVLQPLHFPQYDVNIGRRRRTTNWGEITASQRVKYTTGTT
jgi:hypothetical protein